MGEHGKDETARRDELFRLLVENVLDYAIFVVDVEGRVHTWSEGAERLLGYSEEEILGEPADRLYTPEDLRDGVPERERRQALATGRGEEDRWHVRKDGSRFWSGGVMTPLWDEDRTLRGFAKIMRDRTEWKRAEDARQESEARRAAVLETSLDGILTIDQEDRIVEFNPAAERIFGYRRRDVLGRRMAELLVPERLRDAHYRGMARYLATGEGPVLNQRIQLSALRADGSEFPVELAIIRVPGDGPPLFTGYVRDITEREAHDRHRAAQLAVTEVLAEAPSLRDAAPRILRAVCESLGWDLGAFWLVDHRAQVIRCLDVWHSSAVRVEGFEKITRAQVLAAGEGLPGRVWGAGQPLWVADVTADGNFPRLALAAEVGLHGAFAVPLKLGAEVLGVVEFLSRSVREPDADLLGAMATIGGLVGQFIERKSNEERLRQSEERFRQLAENVTDVFWVADPLKPELLYVSPAYERIWGRPCESLNENPRSFAEAVHLEDRGRVIAALGRQVRGEATTEEYRVVRPDGTLRWVWDRGFPVKDASGSVYRVTGIAEDITERKLAEQTLRESEARLRRIVESNVVGLIVADFRGRVLEANDAFLGTVGYTQDDLRSGRLNFLDLTPPEYRPLDEAAMAEMTASGRHAPYEKEYVRKDGGRVPVLVGTAYLGEDRDGNGLGVGFIMDLTERQRAGRAVRESEERFRGLMEQAPFSVQVFSSDGRIVRVNRAWEELWGVTLDQIPEYNILQDPQLDAKGILPLIRRAFGGEAVRIPAIKYDPNESIPDRTRNEDPARWVAAVAYPLKDTAGRVREVVLVHEDMTARVRAEEALRESEAKFRLMADTIPQLAWMGRPDGHIFWYNRRWHEYTGTTPEQMQGWGWQTVHDPAVLPAVLERWKRSIASGEPFDMVFPLKGADGLFRPFLTRVNPLRGEGGRILYWFGTNTDISEQKRAEDASRFLADASATLAAVVDFRSMLQKVAGLAVPRFGDWCAVDMLEPDGSLRRLAVAHADPAKVQLAHELDRRYPPDPDAPLGAPHVARTGESEISEDIPDSLLESAARDEEHLRILRELGLRSYLCVPMKARGKVLGVLTLVAAESGRRYGRADLALAEELAARAAVAVENTRLYDELRDADRRKDEFLAMLAHELRNPLAPIRSGLDLLGMIGTDGQIIGPMQQQVEHLVRLVDDLLDVSRIMRGKVELRREPVELPSVVARAVETARPMIEAHGHEFSLNLPPESVVLDADPVRLAQVIANLLNNAAKYTPDGGRIRLTARAEDGEAVVAVSDTGTGIEPDLLPRVFDLFTQADRTIDRSQGGLGIGLTVVKSLVEMHGGSVSAYSEGLGKGSTFTLRLPLGRPVASEAGDGTGPDSTGTYRILVVDDNVAAAKMLAMLLRKLDGHEVFLAHDGPSALEAANVHRPDIILLDIGLPKMDGYEVARRLRQRPEFERTLVVALTGYGTAEDRQRSLHAGCDDHLVKPPGVDALKHVLAHPKLPGM